MIRVCHIITDLDVAGAEMMLARLARRMDPARFTVKVVSLIEPGRLAGELRAAGVDVETLNVTRGRPSLRGALRMIALLRRERPAIVQTWLYHGDLLGLVGSWFAGRPKVVWNVRSTDMWVGPQTWVFHGLIKLLALLSPLPAAVVANSIAGIAEHKRVRYRPRRWIHIPNGVDTERFRPRLEERTALRRALDLPDGALVIGMVARFHDMKDHATFLAAAKIFLQQHANAVFLLAGLGTDPGPSELTKRVTEAGLTGKVRGLGVRRDLENVYPALDLMTLSSAYGEGCPNVLLEAMACGVPCVATKVGDCARIIGPAGHIVPPRNPATLAAAWDGLLKGNRKELGAAARARCQELFDIRGVVAAYERTYEELAEATAKHERPAAAEMTALSAGDPGRIYSRSPRPTRADAD
jgi:glycosyltransferase involved in cell wall biosynthesis